MPRIGQRGPARHRQPMQAIPSVTPRPDPVQSNRDDVERKITRHRAPSPCRRGDFEQRRQQQGRESRNPRTRSTRGTLLRTRPREQERRPGDHHHEYRRPRKLCLRRDEMAMVLLDRVFRHHHRNRHEQHGHNREPECPQPRLGRPFRHQRLRQPNRHRDAPDRVKRQHKHRPPGADAQRRNVGVIQQVQIQPQIIRIEQGLGREGFFENPVRQRQNDHPRPSAAGASHDLADQQRSPAIYRRENQNDAESGDREIPEQKFGDQRRKKIQPERRGNSSYHAQLLIDFYSYAKASIGSFCAALYAGYSAPVSAPAIAINVARSTHALLQNRRSTGFSNMIMRRVTRLIMTPAAIPITPSSMVSRRTTFTMYHLEAPIDFRMPISRVRSITAVYIAWKITRNPTTTATPITISIARLNPGRLSGVIIDRYSAIERTEYCSMPGFCLISFVTASRFAGSSTLT